MFPHPYQIFNYKNFFQTALQFPDVFQPRKQDSHKGDYGTLGIIGGSKGMTGAVVLAATAAIYNGCGKVWAGFQQPQIPLPIISERPEIMITTAQELKMNSDINAWVIGCGLGLEHSSQEILIDILQNFQRHPLLLDADALTLLVHVPELQKMARAHSQLVLTPHPAEAARLLNISTSEIQANRSFSAYSISQKFEAITVLKGHQTIISLPNGKIYINQSGNPGLASAGSGDVLSGIIGSLLAQNIDTLQAARAGVWLHGAAADILRDSGVGEIGLLAGEIAPVARWLRNYLSERNNSFALK